MYYKQKLQVHNFTVKEAESSHVELYVWHEVNGEVTVNEFTTYILDYLIKNVHQFKIIVIVSDGCNYQNSNKILACAFRSFAKKHNIIVR